MLLSLLDQPQKNVQKTGHLTVVEGFFRRTKRLVVAALLNVERARQGEGRQPGERLPQVGYQQVPAQAAVAVVERVRVLHHEMRGDCGE